MARDHRGETIVLVHLRTVCGVKGRPEAGLVSELAQPVGEGCPTRPFWPDDGDVSEDPLRQRITERALLFLSSNKWERSQATRTGLAVCGTWERPQNQTSLGLGALRRAKMSVPKHLI